MTTVPLARANTFYLGSSVMTLRSLAWTIALLVYVIVGVAAFLGSLEPPGAGMSTGVAQDGTSRVAWVEPTSPAWSAGIRSGDRVLNTSVEPGPSSGSGSVHRVLVESAQTGQAIEVIGKRPADYNAVTNSGLFLASLVYFIIGSLVFHRGPRRITVTVFFFLCLAAALALSIAPATGNWLPWAVVGEGIAVIWVSTLFPLFFFVFPHQSHGGERTLRFALMAATISGAAMTAGNVWMRMGAPPYLTSVLRQLVLAFMAAGATIGAALVVRSYMGLSTETQREQLRVTLFGGLLSSLPFVFLSLVPTITGWYQSLPPTQMVLASIALPLSLAYAIMRYQLLGIRRLIHQGAVYGVLAAILLSLYTALVVGANRLMPSTFSSSFLGQFLNFFAAFLVVTTYDKVRRLAERLVDTMLYRSTYDYREAVQAIGLQAALTDNLAELGDRMLPMICGMLGVDFAVLMISENSHQVVRAGAGEVPDGLARSVWAQSGRDGLFEVHLEAGAGNILCTTLIGKGAGKSLLCLGPKKSGEPFMPDDRQLLRTLASNFTIIIDKLRLLDELERQVAALQGATRLLEERRAELKELTRRLVQAQEEERSRIALYVHDEPLQRALLLRRAANDGDLDSVVTAAEELANDLRNFSVRLHPAWLDDLGLVAAIEWLCDEAGRKADFEVGFITDGIDDVGRLPSNVELALFRATQEALTNCQKHSQASEVRVELKTKEGEVMLTISDNGVGIKTLESVGQVKVRQLGIVGMRERVEALGGTLQLRSNEPQGTVVEARVPLGLAGQEA